MIEETLYARLTAHAGLTALVGTRIYPRLMPQTPTQPLYPALVYNKVSATRDPLMGSDSGIVHGRWQIDAYDADPDTCRDVTEQLRLALERWRGAGSGGTTVQDTFIDNQQDPGPELVDDAPVFRTITDVMIHYTE